MDLLKKIRKKIARKEVFISFDPAEYTAAINKLKQADIPYEVKYTYTGYGNQQGGRISSFGENVAKQTEYQIYVSNSDYEDARYCIRKQ